MTSSFSYRKLWIGFLFLCIPSFHAVDLLPDAVGLFLIAAACRPLAAGIAAFEEAERAFTKAAYFALLRIPAGLLVLSLWAGAENGALSPLDARERTRAVVAVLTLGFAILEAIFLLSAFARLFAALDHLGQRQGFLCAARMKDGKSTSFLFNMTFVFLVARGTFEFLPSLFSLCMKEPPSTSTYLLLTLAFLALSAVFGCVMLVDWREQLLLLQNDAECNAYFTKTIADTREATKSREAAHRFSLSMALGTAAAVFALDLTLDALPILPDFLTGICLLFVLYALKDNGVRYRHAFTLGIVYTSLSFVAYVLNLVYLRLFETYNAVNVIDAAYLLYTVYAVVAVLEAIALALLLISSFRFFFAHLGRIKPERFTSKAKEQAFFRLGTSLIWFLVTGLLTVALSIPTLFLQTEFVVVPANTEMLGKSTVLLQAFPYMGLICFVAGLVFAVASYIFFSRLKGEIENQTK